MSSDLEQALRWLDNQLLGARPPEEVSHRTCAEAADTLAAVREWAESEIGGKGDDVRDSELRWNHHGFTTAQDEVLAILNRSEEDRGETYGV